MFIFPSCFMSVSLHFSYFLLTCCIALSFPYLSPSSISSSYIITNLVSFSFVFVSCHSRSPPLYSYYLHSCISFQSTLTHPFLVLSLFHSFSAVFLFFFTCLTHLHSFSFRFHSAIFSVPMLYQFICLYVNVDACDGVIRF